MIQIDSENADRDLTSQVTVLTHTPSLTHPCRCIGHIALGDGSKDLDGSGGTFEFTISVGGQVIQPEPQEVEFSTDTRAAVFTAPFVVPANSAVLLKVKSPNTADTDVDVTATLYMLDVSAPTATEGRPVWHVSASGNNSNDGKTHLSPKATVTSAMAVAAEGDLILVGAGAFTESHTTWDEAITVRGAGWGATTIGFSSQITLSDTITFGQLTFANTVADTALLLDAGGLVASDCRMLGARTVMDLTDSSSVILERTICQSSGAYPAIDVSSGTARVTGCWMVNSGSGNVLVNDAGTLIVDGTYYDASRTSGTILHSQPDSQILADTAELQTDWANGGRIDLLIDGIKTKTDGLNFTGTDVKATLDGEEVVTDSASREASKADVSALTTLLNRLGAFTGTGVNTVLGFLKAIASKAATLPSDIGGTFSPATDSLEAIQEDVGDMIGDGPILTTVTVQVAGVPVDGVTVELSTDLAKDNIIARGTTDTLGVVYFNLDAGSYYVWRSLAGYDFTQPSEEVIADTNYIEVSA